MPRERGTTGSRSRYRGSDRRRVTSDGLPWAAPTAGAAIFVATVTIASWPTGLDLGSASTILTSAALVGSVLLAVMASLAWRTSGRTAPVWLAMAASAYAVALLLRLGELVPDLLWAAAGPEALRSLAAASPVVALAGLVCAALWQPVDTRLKPLRVVAAGGAAVVLVALALTLTPGVATALLPSTHPAVTGDVGEFVPPVPAVLPAAWAVVAGLLAAQAHRRDDAMLAWATLLALTLGGAEALRQLVGAPEGVLAAEFARAVGIFVAATAVGACVAGLATVQRRALGSVTEASRAAEGRVHAADAAQAELRHEVHNALTAVHAAAATLHTHHERLAPDDRAELSGAVSREIERLRLLVDSTGGTGALAPVQLARAVESAVIGSRAQGISVHVDLPSHLWVLGREEGIAQVVSALLDNAHKHAPGSPVWLRAARQGGGVVLRCEDRGPGVPVDERQRVFDRGQRGRQAGGEGSGLGLAVVAKVVREQGGTIWVDDHPGGGASFAVWLARPPEAGPPSGSPRGDEDAGVARGFSEPAHPKGGHPEGNGALKNPRAGRLSPSTAGAPGRQAGRRSRLRGRLAGQ